MPRLSCGHTCKVSVTVWSGRLLAQEHVMQAQGMMDVGTTVAAAFVTNFALPDSAVTCVLGQPDCRRHAFHFDPTPQFQGFLARVPSVRPGSACRPLQADGLCSCAKFEGHWPLGSAMRSIALTRPAMAVLTPPCWRPLGLLPPPRDPSSFASFRARCKRLRPHAPCLAIVEAS